MKLYEEDGNWRLELNDGAVQMLQIDFRLGIVLYDAETIKCDNSKGARLSIGQPCQLKGPDGAVLLIPGEASTLAPILPLFCAKVMKLSIQRTGHLELKFGDGWSLAVAPHQQYEAWDLFGPDGEWLVCKVGGELEFFPPNRTGIN